MSRGRRAKRKDNSVKYFIYLSGGVLLAVILTFIITLVVYNNRLKDASYSSLSTKEIADLVPNTDEYVSQINGEIEEASTDIGKSIEEAINSIEEKEEENVKVEEKKEEVQAEKKTTKNNNTVAKTEQKSEPEKVEVVKDPEFAMPVSGEIGRGYAKDTLVYSDTLEEWIVHLGIDIKADRTTVVKASEAGTITSIKNDPRYGLTVVIEHTNGYKSVYSNLLTTEFVTEGDKVEKGQSIGTVGNSAAFEIVDEPHLHFEILKDGVNVDPNIYIK